MESKPDFEIPPHRASKFQWRNTVQPSQNKSGHTICHFQFWLLFKHTPKNISDFIIKYYIVHIVTYSSIEPVFSSPFSSFPCLHQDHQIRSKTLHANFPRDRMGAVMPLHGEITLTHSNWDQTYHTCILKVVFFIVILLGDG